MGPGEKLAEQNLPAAAGQGPGGEVRGVDRGAVRDAVELQSDTAVSPLLGVGHHPGLNACDPGQLRQDAAVLPVQVQPRNPVIRQILGVKIPVAD